MAKPAGSDFQGLGDAGFTHLYVRAFPGDESEARAERRHAMTREALVRRIRSEFEEMPGLSLTLAQAARLFGLQPDTCLRVLLGLCEQGFVRVRGDGRYVLRSEAA